MSYQQPGPRPQRSTPIPGGDNPAFGSPTPFDQRGTAAMPGNWGAGAPPTPTEFAAGRPASSGPIAPIAPPPAMQGMPGMYGMPGMSGMPGMPGMYGMPGMGVPYVATKRRRSFGGLLVVLLLVAGPAIGVGVGIWAFIAARDAVSHTQDLIDAKLSDSDRRSLGLGDGVTSLFDPGAAPAVVAAFQANLAGPNTKFTHVLLYPDYAFADAQDPSIPTHLDEYGWRSGAVGTPTPQQNDPELATKLFGSSDVNWDTVAALTAAAPSLLQVEQGAVSHVIVERSSSTDQPGVVVSVYVSGPRSSGFLQANALTGEVLDTH